MKKILIALTITFSTLLLQAAPDFIRIQGRLTDSKGVPITGQPKIRVSLFDQAEGGQAFFTSALLQVDANNAGLFSTNLEGIKPELFTGKNNVYLEIIVRDVTSEQTLKPRQPMASVVFAFDSLHAKTADAARSVSENAIRSTMIANGQVMTEDIAAESIDSTKIKNGSIIAAHISTGAVTENSIKEGSVHRIHLATDAVSIDDIPDGILTGAKFKPKSIDGALIIDHTISSNSIDMSSIDSLHIKDQTITEDDIGAGEITASLIQAEAIGSKELADGGIASVDLATGSVNSDVLVDSAVVTSKLVDGAVTTDKIADKSITSAKIADGVITPQMIPDGSIARSKLDSKMVIFKSVQLVSVLKSFSGRATFDFPLTTPVEPAQTFAIESTVVLTNCEISASILNNTTFRVEARAFPQNRSQGAGRFSATYFIFEKY